MTTFSYTGSSQTYTVPAGVTSVGVTAYGGAGGSNSGGVVGMTGTLSVTPGDVLTIYVAGAGAIPSGSTGGTGGWGYGTGGNGGNGGAPGSGGGGSTAITGTGGTLILVAAGSGGTSEYQGGAGGIGGSPNGADGTDGSSDGTHTIGYHGSGATISTQGLPGSTGGAMGGTTTGASGGNGGTVSGAQAGSGGGAGYYGGGGGGAAAGGSSGGGGGGGGSSYLPTGFTWLTGSSASVVITAPSAPSAPTLTAPANLATKDATLAIPFTATYNSTDGSNQNAYALRIKVSSGSYQYWNATSAALQSTIVWNAVSTAPGASWTVTLPTNTLTNGNTFDWSMASQESSANLQGTFASDFSFTAVAGPNGGVQATFASAIATSLPTSAGVNGTFRMSQIDTGGTAIPDLTPWMLPVAINTHSYMMDFTKSRVTTMQIRRQSADSSVEPGEQCVDEATEILTQRGWLKHAELHRGDIALTLNMETGLSEWQVVEDVRRYERENFSMWSMKGRGHSSLTTLNHRWPVEYLVDHGKSGKKKAIRIHTSEQLNTKDSIFTGAACATLPTEPKYSNELVELVAWFWTEGNITLDHRKEKPRRLTIAQHPVANPEKVNRIRECLTRLYGPAQQGVTWYEYRNPGNGVILFHLTRGAFDDILDACENGKVVRPEWLCNLTAEQLELFIDVSVLGDGWIVNNHVALSQKEKAMADAFQYACVLAGRVTNNLYERAPNSANGFRWKVSARKGRARLNPVLASRKKSNGRGLRATGGIFNIETVNYTGTVWCPRTQNQTWCARRDGHVYFTGNTLSAAGVWPRAQDNYFLGAGQEFLDNRFAFESVYVHSGEYPSVRTRYWKSLGVNPWKEGQLTLQKEYAPIATSSLGLVIIQCGSYLYKTDGSSIYWSANVLGVISPSWTKVTSANTNTIVSLATDGSRVWFATGSQGVYVTVAGTTISANASTPAALNGIGGLLAYPAGAGTTNATNMPNGSTTWSVTEVDAFGNETASVTATVTVASTPVNLNWNPDTNASLFNVYRGSKLVYSGTAPSFVDDGSVVGTTRTPPTTNATGVTPYAATFILYAKGHLIGSTGRDLVEILANGNVSFIFQHENPAFLFTCGCESPTAILVGGYAGANSYVGAIQPDTTNAGATLAPPTWATTLTTGEQINDIQYDAGAILLATSAGIRSGTKPDGTGAFDVNPVITDPGSVNKVVSWGQYMYFSWSNYNPVENWALLRPTVSGIGRADLSQYTTAGVPAYATDAMGATGGITTEIVVISGTPYFVVDEGGAYTLYGPTNSYVQSGWIEPGWIRYGTLESKIIVEVDMQHKPLPATSSINYLIVAEDEVTITDVGTSNVAGTTTVADPLTAGLMVGDRFMPVITLYASADQSQTPVFLSHITKAMVTTQRQDEILLALVWADTVQTLGEASTSWFQDCFAEYWYLKGLEKNGQVVSLTMAGATVPAYIDQVMLEPVEMNAVRTWFQGTVTVKAITLGYPS